MMHLHSSNLEPNQTMDSLNLTGFVNEIKNGANYNSPEF